MHGEAEKVITDLADMIGSKIRDAVLRGEKLDNFAVILKKIGDLFGPRYFVPTFVAPPAGGKSKKSISVL